MKRHFLFIVMAVLLVGPGQMLHAQLPEVSTLPGIPYPQNTISRQYENKTTIHYFEDRTGHYFVLQDPSNPLQSIQAKFPRNLEIHDFEIYKDFLYFCGKRPGAGNPTGIVGFIPVYDLFYNNGQYNISYVNSLSLWGSSTYSHMTSCDKMDLFVDNSGIIHMAVVGELAHSSDYSELRRTYADIWYDGYAWKGNVMYHKDDLYKPTDITCTDRAVVITAYDEYRNGAVILVYKKYDQFPNYPVYPHVIKIADPMLIADNVLVERLRKDDVVVTNLYKDPITGETGTALHFIEDVTSLPNNGNFLCYHIKHSLSYIPQMELRYNKDKDRLLMAYDLLDNPHWGFTTPTFFSLNGYNNSANLILSDWIRPDLDIKRIMAIDNRKNANLLSLSGIFGPTAEPLMCIKGFADQGCYNYIEDKYRPLSSNFSPSNRDVPCMDFYNRNITISTTSTEIPVEIYCKNNPSQHFSAIVEVEEYELSMAGLNDAGETLLGINDDKAVDFAISPNPAKNVVSLKCTESIQGTIEIIDIQGKSWCKKAIEGNLTEINVSTLPAGTYLMRLTTPDGTTTKKLNIE